MSSAVKSALSSLSQFAVVSIEKTPAPEGSEGGNWYKYVVARDNSKIVGNMRGTLQQVTKYADEFVENLNNRASLPRGRSSWAPSPSKKQLPEKN